MRSIQNQLNAWMDGNALTDLHPMLFIEEISCTPAEATFTTSVTARRNGERLLNTRRTTPTVTITLRILTEDRVSRQTVYQRLVTWASGRELRISDRPGQALHCVCTKLPEMSSVMKWTESFSLTLSGFEHPFWEETVPSQLSISGSSDADGRQHVDELQQPGRDAGEPDDDYLRRQRDPEHPGRQHLRHEQAQRNLRR